MARESHAGAPRSVNFLDRDTRGQKFKPTHRTEAGRERKTSL